MPGATAGFEIGRPVLQETPFQHFGVERCVARRAEAALLAWFEQDAPWRLVETDFYEQYEFSLLHAARPASVVDLFSASALDALRRQIAETFRVQLAPRMDAVAHKLIPGQRIAIHNDYLVGQETHRLTVQLNHGLGEKDGGVFMLFNSFDAADVHSIYRPVSGSAIGFAIGPDSHHAVSRVHGGVRFTLVFSFYADTAGS